MSQLKGCISGSYLSHYYYWISLNILQHTHLFLTVLNCQFQSCKIITTLFFYQAIIISVIKNNFQFPGTPCLIQEIFCKLLALPWQFLILRLKLIFDFAQFLQLPAQLKSGKERILTGQSNQWWACQSLVDIESGPRVAQAVHIWAWDTFDTVAAHLVGPGHRHPLLHKELYDLVIVGVGSQNYRCDVRCKFWKLLVQKHWWHLWKKAKTLTGLLIERDLQKTKLKMVYQLVHLLTDLYLCPELKETL